MIISVSHLQPVAALIAVSILVIPRLLNYIVAIYLIIIGILGLNSTAVREEKPMATEKQKEAAKKNI